MIVLIQCFPCGFVSLSSCIIFSSCLISGSCFSCVFSSFYLARSLNMMCVLLLIWPDYLQRCLCLILSVPNCSMWFVDQVFMIRIALTWCLEFAWICFDQLFVLNLICLICFDQIMSIWFYLGRIVWANLFVLSLFIVLVICLALSFWLIVSFNLKFGLCQLNCLFVKLFVSTVMFALIVCWLAFTWFVSSCLEFWLKWSEFWSDVLDWFGRSDSFDPLLRSDIFGQIVVNLIILI